VAHLEEKLDHLVTLFTSANRSNDAQLQSKNILTSTSTSVSPPAAPTVDTSLQNQSKSIKINQNQIDLQGGSHNVSYRQFLPALHV
jgi:hypothetical protein